MCPDPANETDDNKKNRDVEEPTEVVPEVQEQTEESTETSSDTTDPSPLSVQVTPGTYLLTAREKSGLNRARVGQALGLTETAVKNLETNDFDLFPSGVYVRGYLKNYAKLLGSDEDELIDIYDRYCAEHRLDNGRSVADLSAMPASQGNNRKIFAVVAGVLVVAVLAYIVFSSFV